MNSLPLTFPTVLREHLQNFFPQKKSFKKRFLIKHFLTKHFNDKTIPVTKRFLHKMFSPQYVSCHIMFPVTKFCLTKHFHHNMFLDAKRLPDQTFPPQYVSSTICFLHNMFRHKTFHHKMFPATNMDLTL